MLTRLLTHLTLGGALALGGVFALGALSPRVEATTLSPLSVEQMTDAADLVVRATVTEVWVEQLGDELWTRAQITVNRSLKGQATGRTLVIDQVGGVLRNDAVIVVGAPRFSVGEEILVFLEKNCVGQLLVVGMSQGKYTVRIDPQNGQEMLVRFTVRQDRWYDHNFIPHPAVADRVYVADLETQVQNRVATGWDGQPIPGASDTRLREINRLQPGVK
jgi:hypothetical protein